jgi:transposase
METPTVLSYHELLVLFQEKEQRIGALEAIVDEQSKRIEQLEALNRKQVEEISLLKKLLFGKKSEKSAPKTRKDGSDSSKTTKRSESRDGFNDPAEAPEGTYPSHLPRKKDTIDDLPEGADPNDYYYVGDKVTERLAVEPAQFYVIVTRRKIYKRKSDGLFVPSHSQHPLGRCSADMSFVIYAIIQKILFHIPFYRLEKILQLQGIPCHRSSFIRWTTTVASLLQPIAQAILRDIKDALVVHGDESPTLVKCKEKDTSSSYRSVYFWNLVAPDRGIYFQWTKTRNNTHAKELLEGIKGIFVSDALGIYTHATETLGISWQICWIHIRRNFLKITSNRVLAKEALARINLILAIDKAIRRRTRQPKHFYQRTTYRKRFLIPLVDDMKQWISEKILLPEVQSDEYLLKAFQYINARWEQATCFITNPHVLPHNNISEQFFRHLKLGSKNWLFCASELGADTLCTLYTLTYSAKVLGINPGYYLADLINQISVPGVTAEDLTPRRWKESREKIVVPDFLRKN